jgi:hypothetical protein
MFRGLWPGRPLDVIEMRELTRSGRRRPAHLCRADRPGDRLSGAESGVRWVRGRFHGLAAEGWAASADRGGSLEEWFLRMTAGEAW